MLQLKEAALLVFFTKRRAAILKMRTDRDNFLRMKSGAIYIQRTWRRRLAIRDNNLQEIAQQQRSYYQQLRATNILLQRRWRSLRVQKKNVARREQARIENAAVVIQRRWRASALMKRDRTAFKNLETAVQVISERRFALNKMRKQVAQYTTLKRSVIFLQRKWKATLLMRKNRSYYSAFFFMLSNACLFSLITDTAHFKAE
ncbi:hypothetical protein LSTR_LSTR011600 [Laodelphax striatellus]|uniref:Uncharacterized protein n=1 Tax=Laodelphax striatellus TaxID=195883 RepID=A0A482X6V4_LAOST|nr:hypothetical protein LSTR_LSTR011599 [Laodelphax striatellus]RZF41219.1 hypothetical protein LSTR_LSTR011600 [Laodelphax striatellus]